MTAKETEQAVITVPETADTPSGNAVARQRPPIGELLRTLRGDRTLRDLERDTGIPNSYLSNVENGAKRPGLKTLTKLAEYHQVPLNELLRVTSLPHEENREEGIPALDVMRSFRFVTTDPDLYRYTTPNEDIPLEIQKYIVQLYEHYTGKKLL